MTLHDEIIDEATELARNHELRLHASTSEIVTAVSDRINIQLQPNSIGARLAEAAYNRIAFAEEQIVHATT